MCLHWSERYNMHAGDSRMSDADSMEDEGSSNQKKRGRKAGKAQGSQNG